MGEMVGKGRPDIAPCRPKRENTINSGTRVETVMQLGGRLSKNAATHYQEALISPHEFSTLAVRRSPIPHRIQ
jgi:hypothetical protein